MAGLTLQLIIEKARLDYLEENIEELKERVNRAIFIGENRDHKTHPIHYVCECVHALKFSESKGLGFISLLLKHGSEVNGYGKWEDDSPLLAAIGYYQREIAHFLLDNGADYTHRGFHGATALHWAAWTGDETLVKALLEFPVDIEAADHDFGATPLLFGIHGYFRGGERNANNQIECIRMLLAAGADPFHKDKEGNDAWGYLKGRSGEAVLSLLPGQN